MKLSANGQPARIARWGYMRWFTTMDVIRELAITQPHPRIVEIRAAGGVVVPEPIEVDGVKMHRYMVTKMPAIRGADDAAPTSGVVAEGETAAQ